MFFRHAIYCCSWKTWDGKREGSQMLCWWSSRGKSQWVLAARPGTGAPWDTKPIDLWIMSGETLSCVAERHIWDRGNGDICLLQFLTPCSMCLLCISHQTPKGMKLVRFMKWMHSSKSLMATIDLQRFRYVCEHCWTPASAQPQSGVRVIFSLKEMRLTMQRLAGQQGLSCCNFTVRWLIHLWR